MQIEILPLAEAVGHILLHNQIGADGRKALKKGHLLTAEDVPALQALGLSEVYVAVLGEDDVPENEAAQRIGEVLVGTGLALSKATTGRVNLFAEEAGLFKVNPEALLEINDYAGITLATIPTDTPVAPKTLVGTIKIIPYGVPEMDVSDVITVIRRKNPVVQLKPFVVKRAVLITTGSQDTRTKLAESFGPALEARLAVCDTELIMGPHVLDDEIYIQQAVTRALAEGFDLILIAGETSIMDSDDITPRAIKAAGGSIVHHGVPVEPGNLMLLAYHNAVPIVGAPGCARSKSYNVVDMVLPRLVAGERLARRDLIALGHGGLLKHS